MSKPNNRLAQYRKNRGFTMIELMISVLVLGILASIAIPSYRSFVSSQRMKTASFDFIAALTMARSEAIKRNASVAITPTGANWQLGWAVATVTAPPPIVTLSNQPAFKGLIIDCWVGGAPQACPANVTYASSGRLDTNSLPAPFPSPFPTFRIGSPMAADTSVINNRCISIDLSGRPNSKKSTNGTC